jgi:threonine/homoserine/homoserine lactone efflux protein
MRWGGVAFLTLYGLRSLRAAWAETEALETERRRAQSLRAALATVLVFTWANPHVYLDTVGLIGAVARPTGRGAGPSARGRWRRPACSFWPWATARGAGAVLRAARRGGCWTRSWG